jgi:RNA-dependent RNA polymerase
LAGSSRLTLVRIFQTLRNGIRVGDRHYQFLAFGSSQLKQSSAFFFSPTDHLTCDDIRNAMGDFSTIKTVAKYAARLGQGFSTTRYVPGATPAVKAITDVKRNGHCFTDGVGKISPYWAEQISAQFETSQVPSAFQYRMGGCKGMLTVWDDVKGLEVHIRPSQEKFRGAISQGLDIVRCSSTSVATLNQQIVIILSTIGVPDEVFLSLLERDMQEVNRAMTDAEVAAEELSRRVDENQTTLEMVEMIANGFMESHEPFTRILLQLWRSWTMKHLKEKAKITSAYDSLHS